MKFTTTNQMRYLLIAFVGSLALSFSAVNLIQAEDSASDKLLRRLLESDSKVRLRALDLMASRPKHAAVIVPALTKLLTHDDADTRHHAARTLGALGKASAESIDELAGLLSDKEAKVRAQAAHSIGAIGDPKLTGLKALSTAIADDDIVVRRAAIDALRKIHAKPEVVLPLVVDVLKKAKPDVALRIVRLLAEAGEKSVPRLRVALKDKDACYWACLVAQELGPKAAATVPELSELLKSTEPEVQLQALLALAAIGEKANSAADAVTESLKKNKEQPGVRYAAVFALGQIGATAATETLRKAAGSDDDFMVLICNFSLAKLNPKDEAQMKLAVKLVVAGLINKDQKMRRAAAVALHELNPPDGSVGPVLIKALEDVDDQVKAYAIDAFASLGPDAADDIAKGLKHKKLRSLVVETLAIMGPNAKGAVAALIAELQTAKDGEFKAQVQHALGEIGPDAAEATILLAASLKSDDEDIRDSAAFALRNIGPKAAAAVEALKAEMGNKDAFRATAAAWALSAIKPKDANLAKQVVPLLIKGLGSETAIVRFESAYALANYGSTATSANTALQAAVKTEKDTEVQRAIKAAIKATSATE